MSIFGNGYGIKDFVSPVANARITSPEGPRKSFRTDNGAMSSSFHKGVDVVGDKNIKNITGGKVRFAGQIKGYGNVVIVDNPDGYSVQYSHLANFTVKQGDTVAPGQQIATMGATGNATGVHLDMIVSKGGKVLNRNGTPFGEANAKVANLKGGSSTQSYDVPTAMPQFKQAPVPTVDPYADLTTPQYNPQAPETTQVSTTPQQSNIQTDTQYDIFDVPKNNTTEIAVDTLQGAIQKLFNGNLMNRIPLDTGVEQLFESV